MLKPVIALVSGCCLAAMISAAQAQENQGLNLFVGPGYQFLHDDSLDNSLTGNVGIGYRFSEDWGVEAIYSILTDVDFSSTLVNSNGDGDAWSVGFLRFLPDTADDLEHYVSFGAGLTSFDFDTSGLDYEESTYYLGYGIKKYFTDRLALRGDIRAQNFADSDEHGVHVMLGLDYAFGRTSKPVPVVAQGPTDSDGDGVYDNLDQCPGTPAGTRVDANGCTVVEPPKDSDGDGVFDSADACPNTPAGARVDEKGCQYVITETVSVELEVLFPTNQATIDPVYYDEINRVADFMTLFPSTSATIEGHTDDQGAADYNQDLSQRRADAVKKVLVEEKGIAASRLNAVGYGESRPRADNSTAEGRQQNRRVVAVISTEVDKAAD